MNNFLPALFSFFFWGNATSNTEERTRHSSWIRTIGFLILSIAVGLLYLKTLDVSTLMNYVDIRADSYTVKGDSIGERAKIHFHNIMDGDNTRYSKAGKLFEALNFKTDTYGFDKECGGTYFYIGSNNDSTYTIQHRGGFDKSICLEHNDYELNEIYNVYDRVASCWSFSRTFNNDSLQSLLTDSFDIKYVLIRRENKLNHAILFYSREFNEDLSSNFKASMHNYPPTKTLSGWMNVGVDSVLLGEGHVCFVGMSFNRNEGGFSLVGTGNRINHLGFFSAADISQSYYQLLVHSDCPIEEIKVFFNTPVNLQPLPFDVDELSPYGFSITSPELIDKVKDREFRFYLKYPALANKQLVRSLILTTLLTALISLFLTNLYFCLRRIVIYKDVKKRQINKRVQRARYCHNTLVLSILSLFLLYTICVFFDWKLFIPFSFGIWRWVIALGSIFAILCFEYFLYRYSHIQEGNSSVHDSMSEGVSQNC